MLTARGYEAFGRDNTVFVCVVYIITVNGRGDTVSLAYEEYRRMKSRIELLELLAEADEDVNAGRVAPMEDTFTSLRAILKEKRNG